MDIKHAFTETLEKLGKPYQDLSFLLEALKEVLVENNEEDIANQIPWINDIHELDFDTIQNKHLQLYSLIFQLVNLAEINGAVQARRSKEGDNLSSVSGLWANHISKLKKQGFSEDEIIQTIAEVSVEPVLTAHPTEAKRATVLEHYRDLYMLLVQQENKMFNHLEVANIKHNIKQTLYRLWKTGEIYLEKPNVKDEGRDSHRDGGDGRGHTPDPRHARSQGR